MNITQYPALNKAIQAAESVRQSLAEAGANDAVKELDALIAVARQERFVIGVVGDAKRGKSTLVNGLLGRHNDELAPVDRFPATNVTSIFTRAEKEAITVCFQDGARKAISSTDVRQYACEEHNPENCKNVRSIEAEGPFPNLEKGVYVVDTPGANNALSAMHSEILLQFLPHADAVIFLVTAQSPVTAAERNLLCAIRSNDTKKLFFAVNKTDLVASGEMNQTELEEGLAHNRKILADIGFGNAPLFQISAKNYFKKQGDAGTEQLLAAIREMIATKRIPTLVERIHDQTKMILARAHAQLEQALSEAKLSATEIDAERKSLEKARKELQRERPARERQFTADWDDAFSGLETDLSKIRQTLKDKYDARIEETSAMKVSTLNQTIHSDVALCFAELLAPRLSDCEERINKAQLTLAGSIQACMLTLAPLDLKPFAATKGTLTDSLKIGASILPSVVTGAVTATLPGMIGSLITGAAPTVTAMTWNPFTWISAAATGAGAAAVTGVGAVVTGALAALATPVALGAFAFAAYRGVSRWRAITDQQKNQLTLSVHRMIDDGCKEVAEKIHQYRKGCAKILRNFDAELEARLEAADQRLAELLANRPSPAKIQLLENGVRAASQCAERLATTTQLGETESSTSGSRSMMDDVTRN